MIPGMLWQKAMPGMGKNMKQLLTDLRDMRSYLLLWLTQAVSQLGSAMTAYALVIWSYEQAGSALSTALLMVCSYAP